MIHSLFCKSTTASVDVLGRLRCDGCRYIQEPPRAPVKLVSNYRCREHPDCSTSWKGTGCARCAAQKTKRKAPASRDDNEQMERYL